MVAVPSAFDHAGSAARPCPIKAQRRRTPAPSMPQPWGRPEVPALGGTAGQEPGAAGRCRSRGRAARSREGRAALGRDRAIDPAARQGGRRHRVANVRLSMICASGGDWWTRARSEGRSHVLVIRRRRRTGRRADRLVSSLPITPDQPPIPVPHQSHNDGTPAPSVPQPRCWPEPRHLTARQCSVRRVA